MSSYKPEGYKSVTPYLIVNNADAVIDFIRDVFSAKLIESHRDDAGKIIHAALTLDDSVIEISDATDAWPSIPAALHVYVADVDETYRKAIKAGAESLGEPTDKFYGERGAELQDSSGNNWYIATYTGNTTGQSAPND